MPPVFRADYQCAARGCFDSVIIAILIMVCSMAAYCWCPDSLITTHSAVENQLSFLSFETWDMLYEGGVNELPLN